jgi:hypothetical protein
MTMISALPSRAFFNYDFWIGAKLKSLVRAETPILLSAGFIHLARRIGAELAITGTVQKVSNNSTEPAPSVAPPQSLLTEARRRLCGGCVGNLAPRQ